MNSANQGIEVESQQGTDGDNDLNNPDDSILNTEGYVEKVGSIVDYIENDYFYNSIQISRRTPKNKQLQNELFDYSVYTNNQCGFTTSRPLFWVNAIDSYINSSEHIYGKFFTKHPKTLSEKCQYIKILINFDISKKVEILVNSLSGVLLVKGNCYERWISNEFPKVLQVNKLNIDTTQQQQQQQRQQQQQQQQKQQPLQRQQQQQQGQVHHCHLLWI